MLIYADFQGMHVSLNTSLTKSHVLFEIVHLQELEGREVPSNHLTRDQVPKYLLLVFDILGVAQLECQSQLLSRVVVITIVHVVASAVVADVDAPGLGQHFQVEAFALVVFKPFEQSFVEKIELELNFDNMLSQEVCSKFAVVGSWVLPTLEVSE